VIGDDGGRELGGRGGTEKLEKKKTQGGRNVENLKSNKRS